MTKVLLTGTLPDSVWSIASRIVRGEHQTAVLGKVNNNAGEMPDQIKLHALSPSDPAALGILDAVHYNSIVFFYSCPEANDRKDSASGEMLDALRNILQYAAKSRAQQFILITDHRVFGKHQAGLEKETPLPDTESGLIIRTAEELLERLHAPDMHKLLLRVTTLYDAENPQSFFAKAKRCAQAGETLLLPGHPHAPCDFLHAEDLGVFLEYAVSMEADGVFHLHHGKELTWQKLIHQMQKHLPDLKVEYTRLPARKHLLQGKRFLALDWVPRHDCIKELELLLGGPSASPDLPQKKSSRLLSLLRSLLPYIELILIGGVAIALSVAAEQVAFLSMVDYVLLYVAIMGNIHGRKMGGLAALIAWIYYGGNLMAHGHQLSQLLFNTDHWLPLGCYLLCGVLFGYLRDRQAEQQKTQEADYQVLAQQNEFYQSIYQQVSDDRNQLQEQVMHFRDSYGRIYHVTRELDALHPAQVFLSTLHVLEDIMQNESVSIYECSPDKPFLRLVVRSRHLKKAPRSLDFSAFPKAHECLRKGDLFINGQMDPSLPVYAAPICREDGLKAILMLWDVPFEKQSRYYENLFSVVAGLVESALLRTMRYYDLAGDRYLPGTLLLNDKEFKAVLDVYQDIHKNRVGQFLLLKILQDMPLPLSELSEKIGRIIRSTDLAGQSEDGDIYVLLPQADLENLPIIRQRFEKQGLKCILAIQEDAHG